MTKGFFLRLAADNIKKNKKTYIPYILTCILTISMYYIVKSLSLNPGVEKMIGGTTLMQLMFLGSWIVALFAFIFLFYTNSFLVKRRRKEFGVFNILGMEKRHLSIVLGWETLYVALISLSAGLIFGIALDKAMFLLIGKLLNAEIVLGFFIAPKALAAAVQLFAVIFVLIWLNAICQIHVSNPIELLQAGTAGEKEPKTKWLMAVIGTGCIAAGYYMAITVKDPLASILVFFMAVVLVIIGTYMLFTAGSIVFLKMLRKNKRYYYKTKHFTSVSGMIYRMKQNAVGLANICVLSTMVLVMVSSTSSMMVGMEDILVTRYPEDFTVYSNETELEKGEEMFDRVRNLQKEQGLQVAEEKQYTFLSFMAFQNGNTFQVEKGASISEFNAMNALFFIPLSDYNKIMGENKTLHEGEILLYSNRQQYNESVLNLFGKEYRVVEKLDDFISNGSMAANMESTQFIVVPKLEEMNEIYAREQEVYGEMTSPIRQVYSFDTEAEADEQRQFFDKLRSLIREEGFSGYSESRAAAETDFIGLYGGFFFIGIFLGILFVMATVLIIYYKQISEGYDDKDRFAIMLKVGMSQSEVKSSIHSQVLTVFFLPLLAAGVHVIAAFPLMSRLLVLLNFSNTNLYMACTGICFLVFTGMYVLIYMLTARTYYRIVSS